MSIRCSHWAVYINKTGFVPFLLTTAMTFLTSPLNPVIQPWLNKSPKYAVQVIPDSLTFDQPGLGDSSLPQTVSITNKGYADLPIEGVPANRDFIFSLVGDSSVIRPNETLKVDVIYRPLAGIANPGPALKVEFGCGVPLTVVVLLNVTA